MAVQIRLTRHGTRNRPFYHLVAADHKMRRDGRFVEKLGTYDPMSNESKFEIKEDRIQYWYGHGAELSTAVTKILKLKKVKLERFKTGTKA
jgi:small subunit ribosomal protein S16